MYNFIKSDAIGYCSFCSSPKQYKSSTSLNQDRSIHELKDQISDLRKENFNLKLRLHLVEENTLAFTESSRDILKRQLIDVKVYEHFSSKVRIIFEKVLYKLWK